MDVSRQLGRSGSTSSSGFSGIRKSTAVPGSEFEFSLHMTKARVLRVMDEKVASNLFKRFYSSPLCDRLLKTLLLYFVAMFQMDWVIKATEKSRKQHFEGYNPSVVASRIRELNDEVAALRLEVSPIYAELLMKYASYDKGQQDRQFFETVYDMLIAVLDDAFGRLGKSQDVEREIGAIFRTKHFNLYKRRNMPPRSIDTLSVKEIYALKNESGNRVLNARMLAALFEKPPSTGVTVASVTNSPLISQFIASPIVARSMMKDPEQRRRMAGRMAGAATTERPQRDTMSSRSTSRDTHLRQHTTTPMHPMSNLDTASDSGAVSPDLLQNQSRISRMASTVAAAPEAAGLPLDDAFNYLVILKRNVRFGPTPTVSIGATHRAGPASLSRGPPGAGPGAAHLSAQSPDGRGSLSGPSITLPRA